VIQSFLTGNDTPGLKSLKKGLKVLKQKKKQVKETVVGEETKKPWMRRSDDMASRISAAFMKAAGARRRADKMAKVTLNPKTKIGYEIRDVGPGGKSSVVKRENWPKKKNNVKEDTEQVYEILRDADDDFVDIGDIVEPINEGAVKAAMEEWMESLPKAVVDEISRKYAAKLALANLTGTELSKSNPVRKAIIQLLDKHKVKPLGDPSRENDIFALEMMFNTHFL